MTELEKAARMALEQLGFLNACYPHKTAADAITALTQALATTEPAPKHDEDDGDITGRSGPLPETGWDEVPEGAFHKPSPTAGMNLGERIKHVGGRENAAGYIEFGSVAAVRALVRQYLRDLPAPQPATTERKGEPVAWLWQHEETGRKGFVEADQLAMGWEVANPRLKLVTPLYTSPQVPEGFALVPVEPTDAMMDAAEACSDDWPRTTWAKAWAAMLDAARKEPRQ